MSSKWPHDLFSLSVVVVSNLYKTVEKVPIYMDIKMTSIQSATDSTAYFNSSESTINPTVDKDTFIWTNEEITRMIQIIVRPILVVLGTVGNGLTVYVMRTSSLKEISSCFFMFILALADTGK